MNVGGGGFLERKHHKIRFTDLDECFLSRVILFKAKNAASTDLEEVTLSLLDLFPGFSSLGVLENELQGVIFETSDRMNEKLADFQSAMSGQKIGPKVDVESAVDYYNGHFIRRLKYLCEGDGAEFKKCIEDYSVSAKTPLHEFVIQFRPKILAETTATNIKDRFEIVENHMRKLAPVTATASPRIDYRKEVELLQKYLNDRREKTGEIELDFLTRDFPFRHAIQEVELPGGKFSMATPGTLGPCDKLLLPFFLETNGQFDVNAVVVAGDVKNPNDIQIKYSITQPSKRNIFLANSFGLSPETRSRMNESELQLYENIFKNLNASFAFGGRKAIEKSVAELLSWIVRKLSYSLEEPSFLKEKATAWLTEQKAGVRITMEDDFFLPFLYERLKEAFGDRVKKKPEKFGGEIDILFDEIPVELKVRRGYDLPLDDTVVKEKFPPGGQAAAYAAITRVGFVVVLDLPDGKEVLTNLSKCGTVVSKSFDSELGFPTSIVVVAFHCHHPKPSSVR